MKKEIKLTEEQKNIINELEYCFVNYINSLKALYKNDEDEDEFSLDQTVDYYQSEIERLFSFV